MVISIRTGLSLRPFVAAAALAAAAACSATAADYKIKPLNVLPIESYAARTTVAAVTVAVEPYATDEKAFTVFDVKDLNSRGFLPVLVLVHNGTANPLALRTRDIVLVTQAGQEVYSHPATLVVAEGVKGGTSDKSGSPLADFTAKELIPGTVEPGRTVHGFLFFHGADRKKNVFADSALRIPKLTDETTRQALGPFLVPLAPAFAASGDSKHRK